jgi:hypothetical protein
MDNTSMEEYHPKPMPANPNSKLATAATQGNYGRDEHIIYDQLKMDCVFFFLLSYLILKSELMFFCFYFHSLF